MSFEFPREAVLLTTVFLTILFIAVFALLVRDFDKRFSSYLRNSSDRSRLISNQLAIIYDTLLVISTVIKPACIDVLKKYLVDPNNELLKDMYSCSHSEVRCYKEQCCCTCKFQKQLYSLNSDEELRGIAIICSVGGIDTLSSEHGTCPLREDR